MLSLQELNGKVIRKQEQICVKEQVRKAKKELVEQKNEKKSLAKERKDERRRLQLMIKLRKSFDKWCSSEKTRKKLESDINEARLSIYERISSEKILRNRNDMLTHPISWFTLKVDIIYNKIIIDDLLICDDMHELAITSLFQQTWNKYFEYKLEVDVLGKKLRVGDMYQHDHKYYPKLSIQVPYIDIIEEFNKCKI